MKIIYFSPHPNLGLNDLSGYGTHMREIIKGFEDLGHEVYPLIMGGEGNNQESGDIKFKESGIKSILRKVTPRFIWETLKDKRLQKFDLHAESELRKKVKEIQPDLIYERGYYLMSSGTRVAKDLKVKNYIEYNAPYLEERAYFGGKSLLYKKAAESEKFNSQNSNKIVVVTAALKKYYVDTYGLESDKVIVTPNAINPSTFKPIPNQSIPKDTDETVIGFVGSIFPYHKVDLIVKAISRMKAKGTKVRGLIIGGGEILPSLKSLAKELGVSEQIVFTGNVKSDIVPNYIDSMDIAIVPSAKWYMSPVKLFEYGIMGKAVLAPNSSSVEDVLKEGNNALLFDSDEDFYLKLENLIVQEELRTKLAVNLKKDIQEKHTWIKMAEKILG